jgi:hypothetical protein
MTSFAERGGETKLDNLYIIQNHDEEEVKGSQEENDVIRGCSEIKLVFGKFLVYYTTPSLSNRFSSKAVYVALCLANSLLHRRNL